MAIENTFQHQQIDINGISTHIIEAGNKERPTILFLHGYPETSMGLLRCNGPIKRKLSYFISGYAWNWETSPIASSDKFTIASFINDLIHHFNLIM